MQNTAVMRAANGYLRIKHQLCWESVNCTFIFQLLTPPFDYCMAAGHFLSIIPQDYFSRKTHL